MKFMDELLANTAEKFKETADSVWDTLGGSEALPRGFEMDGGTAGKYALTSTLIMAMDFPSDASMYADYFNALGMGPTGASAIKEINGGQRLGTLVEFVSKLSTQRQQEADMMLQQAIAELPEEKQMEFAGISGFADKTATSTYDDLVNILPVAELAFEREAEKAKSKTKKTPRRKGTKKATANPKGTKGQMNGALPSDDLTHNTTKFKGAL